MADANRTGREREFELGIRDTHAFDALLEAAGGDPVKRLLALLSEDHEASELLPVGSKFAYFLARQQR